MKVRMYSVFDVKVAAFNRPFYQLTDGAAARAFIDAVADSSTGLGVHPEDYGLYFVGEFDDADASVFSVKPVHIMSASAAKQASESVKPSVPASVPGLSNGVSTELVS